MGKVVDKCIEFAMNNARVIRDAWAAFVVWCFLAAGLIWIVQGQIYEMRLSNEQSSATTFSNQLAAARGENQDLRAQLASRPDRPDRWAEAYVQASDHQMAELASRMKTLIPPGKWIGVTNVDNSSAANYADRFVKLFKSLPGVKTNDGTIVEHDPKGHGIVIFIRNAAHPSDIDQRYIDAFRLSGFDVTPRDPGDDMDPGCPFQVFISYPL